MIDPAPVTTTKLRPLARVCLGKARTAPVDQPPYSAAWRPQAVRTKPSGIGHRVQSSTPGITRVDKLWKLPFGGIESSRHQSKRPWQGKVGLVRGLDRVFDKLFFLRAWVEKVGFLVGGLDGGFENRLLAGRGAVQGSGYSPGEPDRVFDKRFSGKPGAASQM